MVPLVYAVAPVATDARALKPKKNVSLSKATGFINVYIYKYFFKRKI